jgi:hypothetical protein
MPSGVKGESSRGRAPWLLLAVAVLLPGHAAIPSPERAPALWGLAVGTYADEARRRGLPFPPDMTEVRALGASAVLLPVSWMQADARATHIEPGAETLADDRLVGMTRDASRAGLDVVWMPMVRLRDAASGMWRGELDPDTPDAWWRSYGRFIRHYAELARRAGVDVLVIGSELTSMAGAGDRARWQRLGRRVRRVFAGRLAYVANHDALDRRAPFAAVDIVGANAYFSLADDPDAPARVLRRAWARHARQLERLAHSTDKPLVLFEVGYPSMDGAAVRPWDYTSGAPIDLGEQRDAYEAFARTAGAAPWLDGALFWIWFGPGGVHDRYYTPRDKPAARVLRRLLSRRGAPVD